MTAPAARTGARLVATVAGIGLLPRAGTLAALAALPLGYLLHWQGGFPLLALAAAALFALGFWAAGGTHHPDPDMIVVDKVVGQWVALLPLSYGLWHSGVPGHVFPWPGWVTSFLLFRLLGIWNSWPVSWAERRRGPAGVMLGDLVAGLVAGVGVTLLAAIAHGRPG